MTFSNEFQSKNVQSKKIYTKLRRVNTSVKRGCTFAVSQHPDKIETMFGPLASRTLALPFHQTRSLWDVSTTNCREESGTHDLTFSSPNPSLVGPLLDALIHIAKKTEISCIIVLNTSRSSAPAETNPLVGPENYTKNYQKSFLPVKAKITSEIKLFPNFLRKYLGQVIETHALMTKVMRTPALHLHEISPEATPTRIQTSEDRKFQICPGKLPKTFPLVEGDS